MRPSLIKGRLTGKNLFPGREITEIIERNTKCDLNPAYRCLDGGVSANAKDLLRNLLKKNPHERFTPERALAHEWFKEDKEALAACLDINR